MTFVRKTLKDIGYTKAAYGIEHETCAVLAHIEEQSPEMQKHENQTNSTTSDLMAKARSL
jgi:S-adenosylmethionine synthetase